MSAGDLGDSAWAALLALAALGATVRARRGAALRGRFAELSGERRVAARPFPRRVWRRARVAEDPRLPLATELLAACLAAGASPGAAADAVGTSFDGPLAERLRHAASELRLGGEPAVVWGRLGGLPGAAGLARRLELAGTSGVPAVTAVTAEAAECRARRRRTAQIRARRAAVQVTGPLGLCFLPAFLLIGVAPVVIGMARELL
ncbi:type II secretion system F family protein [Streptomyces litchfieldiae]|uniref:Type II secretion system F family protein n=1 Tax=Streptomyces litchfieldiae TaxID=3075543 RepID=A0ABU2MJV1_9ACTN|nr:type II secretion system F family protein [Streptomyces sp. DSM 44938]MDT0341883.1 type II secretion system F family protein [Streptomyces sp. DSM 44938]